MPGGVVHSNLRHLFVALAACSVLSGGCSYGPVNTASVLTDRGVERIDPKDGPFVIETVHRAGDDGNEPEEIGAIRWKKTRVGGSLSRDRGLWLKYKPWYFHLFSQPAVEVEMPGGHRCTALLDTGCTRAVYVSDLVVRQSDLAVFPMGEHSDTGCGQGYCHIPAMRLGTVTVENPPCWYEQRHWQLRVLGVPLYRHKTMLIGMGMISKFSHVLFDNANRRVRFSPHDRFEPGESSRWVRVPFLIERDNGGPRMMVDLSLGGHEVRAEFDTCGAKPGLILRSDVWDRVADSVNARGGRKALLPSYQDGWYWCRRYRLRELQMGDLVLENMKVDVLPAESEFGQDFEGLLTLDAFRKTAVVLDFAQNVLWIRNGECCDQFPGSTCGESPRL